MRGPIADGREGLLLFVERVVDPRRGIFQGWTVARLAVPAACEATDGLACVPRLTPAWGGRVDLGSVLPAGLTAARVGDETFDERHEVGIAGPDDRDAVRALFTPELMAWLAELPFGRHGEALVRFELRHDVLCVYVRDKQRTARDLDTFAAHAARVADHVEATLG